MKELLYSVKVVTRDEMLSRILDAADRIRNSQRKLNELLAQFTTELVACVAARGGIFENKH